MAKRRQCKVFSELDEAVRYTTDMCLRGLWAIERPLIRLFIPDNKRPTALINLPNISTRRCNNVSHFKHEMCPIHFIFHFSLRTLSLCRFAQFRFSLNRFCARPAFLPFPFLPFSNLLFPIIYTLVSPSNHLLYRLCSTFPFPIVSWIPDSKAPHQFTCLSYLTHSNSVDSAYICCTVLWVLIRHAIFVMYHYILWFIWFIY